MTPTHRTSLAIVRHKIWTPGAAAVVALLASTHISLAQDIVAQRQPENVVPPALQEALAAQNVSPDESVPGASPEVPLLQWGVATVHASLGYRFVYGDGIPAAAGQHETTAINTISPNLVVDLGTHWTVDYTPSWVYYSNSAFSNTVDQSVRLEGWGAYHDWILRLSQDYNASSTPTIETGRQTKEVSSATNFTATYSFNSKLGFEFNAAETYQTAESFVSSNNWSSLDWLHYKVAPELDTAVGFGAGYVDVNQGADMAYSEYQGQVTWSPTRAITLSAHGGIENRQASGGSSSSQNDPIYGASASFRPFTTTTLTFTLDRAISTSFFEDQLTDTTGWTASLRQRLLEHFFLNASLAHQKVTYLSTLNGTDAVRHDDNYEFNANLSTELFRRCSLSVFYQNTHNTSAVASFEISSNQFGAELRYRF